MDERKEGWGHLLNTEKAHYFDERRSTCGQWMTFGVPIWESNQSLGTAPDRGTCKACWRRRAKQESATPTPREEPR
mgnify:CR=1 FL=1